MREKDSHAEAKYEEKSTHAGKHCSICAHFIPAKGDKAASCTEVVRPISPGGYCRWYRAKKLIVGMLLAISGRKAS